MEVNPVLTLFNVSFRAAISLVCEVVRPPALALLSSSSRLQAPTILGDQVPQSSSPQAYVVEDAPEVEPEGDEELIPDDGDGNPSGQSLEEVLQCEAEALAAEIQELEESGDIDTSVLEELEGGVEQAAESLVTMREVRSCINEIKKGRRFGRAPTGSSLKLNGNQVKKKKTRTQC